MSYTYSACRNPRWGDAAHTRILVEVNFDHLGEEWVEFLTQETGDYPHTTEIHARAVAGDFGSIADYVAPPDITGPDAMLRLRKERDKYLAETDFWALSDTDTMTPEQSAYRQALRDLPTNYPNATLRWSDDELNLGYVWVNVTWPSVGE